MLNELIQYKTAYICRTHFRMVTDVSFSNIYVGCSMDFHNPWIARTHNICLKNVLIH